MIGASAPPRKPPKFWIAPSEATRLAGATAVAKDQAHAEDALAKKITTQMQATAMTLLSTSAAGMVKITMPTIATTIALRRPSTAVSLRLVMRSDNQQATRAPINPQRNGIAAATPLISRLMCRALRR